MLSTVFITIDSSFLLKSCSGEQVDLGTLVPSFEKMLKSVYSYCYKYQFFKSSSLTAEAWFETSFGQILTSGKNLKAQDSLCMSVKGKFRELKSLRAWWVIAVHQFNAYSPEEFRTHCRREWVSVLGSNLENWIPVWPFQGC